MKKLREIKQVQKSNNTFLFSDVAGIYQNYLVCKKGTYFPYNHIHQDSKWGCAWRSIQMLLSVNDIQLGFKQMFQSYAQKQKLTSIISDKKPKLKTQQILSKNFSPEENDYNWAQPFIGQLICENNNLQTQLILINGYPKCYAPEAVFEKTMNFREFYEKVKETIPDNIIMIDDGNVALTIIGYKQYAPHKIHFICADPHISSNLEDKTAGIYEVILGQNGQLIQSIVKQEKYYLVTAFKRIDFSNKNWMALFARPRQI